MNSVNNKEVKVSIIVPIYNKEKYLIKSIDSMINQTYQNFELILVDDGSTDNSGLMADEYAQRDKRVSVIHKDNGGPSSAWKAGFAQSNGEYILFADSDDWIDEDMIEKMVNYLKGTKKEIILCDHILESEGGHKETVYQPLRPGEYDRASVEKDILPNLLGSEYRLITLSRCMKLIERSLISENIDYCDSSILMGDDSTIILPCLLDAQRIYNMDHEAMYHYLYVEDSIVHKYDPEMFNNNRKLVDNYRQTFRSKLGTNEELLNKLLLGADKEYIFLLLLVIKNEVRGNKDNYLQKIRQICLDKEVKSLVDANKVKVTEKSNLLLYEVLKHPNYLFIYILRIAMKIYQKTR